MKNTANSMVTDIWALENTANSTVTEFRAREDTGMFLSFLVDNLAYIVGQARCFGALDPCRAHTHTHTHTHTPGRLKNTANSMVADIWAHENTANSMVTDIWAHENTANKYHGNGHLGA